MCEKGARIVKKAWGFVIIFILLNSAVLAESDLSPILLDTPLPAPQASPLQNLDLIPLAAREVQDRSFPTISYSVSLLNPGQLFATPGIKISGPADSLYSASLLSLVALNVADYFTTLEALKYPGVEEKNPMLKSVVKDPYAFAAVKIGFTALACYSMKSLYKKNKPMAWVISVASNLAYSYVVANNFRIIGRCKTR
jgi:hypothetical protein